MSKPLLDTPAKHPFSIAGLLDSTWDAAREAVFRVGWSPVTRMAEAAVVALMERITIGELRVLTLSHIYHFRGSQPDDSSPLKAELRVVNDTFWVRLCTMGDLGFAEAYMYGDVECDDLVSLFLIFLANRENIANMDSRLSYLFALPQKITSYRFLNTIGNSRSNISAHYDISNAMFSGFLSEDMTYSCAIFTDLDGDLKRGISQTKWSGGRGLLHIPNVPGDTNKDSSVTRQIGKDELYDAQMRKLRHILNKANILPGHRVLEIGSGWGSMAMLIAQTVEGTTIDTLTLSVQQQKLAQSRIASAGLQDRIHVHLMDYRSMPADWEEAFDRVISIEMIEAVGFEFLEKYWSVVDWAMKRNGGVGVVQVITIPEPRFDRYLQEIDFIRKWSELSKSTLCKGAENSLPSIVFPGGILPTLTLLLKTMHQGSSGRLIVDSVSNIGPHYARTLREWRRRFLDTFEEVVVPSLRKEYPEVMGGKEGRGEIEVFKRKWLSVIAKLGLRHAPWEIISLHSLEKDAGTMGATSTTNEWN